MASSRSGLWHSTWFRGAAVVVAALAALASAGAASSHRAAGSKPVPGGNLNFNIENAPLTLDPAGAIDATHFNGAPMAYSVYDPLFKLDKNGNLVPMLALSVKASQGNTVFTVRLRQGVKFQDGEPFNAAAVKAQFVRFLQPATNCPCFTELKALRKIEAPSTYVVQFTVRSAWASFPQVVLTSPQSLIAAPNVVAAEGSNYGLPGHRAVGTGPFALKSWTGAGAVLTKNAKYWQKGLPYLSQVTVSFTPSEPTQIAALQAGSLDFVNFSQAPSVVTAKSNGDQGAINLGQGGIGVVLNTTKAPFDNVHVRRAFAYAMDRAAANQIVQSGLASADYGPLPLSSPYMKGIPYLNSDLAKAKAELADYGKPVSFSLLSGNGTTSLAVAQVVQQFLQKAGMTVTINAVKADAASAQALAGNYQAFTESVPRVVVPDQLWDVFHTGGSQNIMNYSNKTVDNALDNARQSTDPKKQLADYRTALTQIEQTAPMVWIYRELGGFAWRPSVHNVPAWDPVGGVHALYLTSVWIDH